MITEQILISLDFEKFKDPYNQGKETFGILRKIKDRMHYDSFYIIYDLEKQMCKCNMSEFCLISRVCYTATDIIKFISAIKFLYVETNY